MADSILEEALPEDGRCFCSVRAQPRELMAQLASVCLLFGSTRATAEENHEQVRCTAGKCAFHRQSRIVLCYICQRETDSIPVIFETRVLLFWFSSFGCYVVANIERQRRQSRFLAQKLLNLSNLSAHCTPVDPLSDSFRESSLLSVDGQSHLRVRASRGGRHLTFQR